MLTSGYDSCDHLHYFHNNGDGTFADRSDRSGLSKIPAGENFLQADFNNDGCIDVLVLRGGWQNPFPLSLLKNNCDGTFTDVAVQAGLGNELFATQTAVWADIDNDGWIDLFVGNEKGPSQLYRNKGDGTFENISSSAESIAAPSARPWSRLTTTAMATRTFLFPTCGGRTFFITTTGTTLSPKLRRRRGWRTPGPTLPPGSSIMTTMAGPTFLYQRLQFDRRDDANLFEAAPQCQAAEALQEHARWHVSGRDHKGGPGQGVHADGREFRRCG